MNIEEIELIKAAERAKKNSIAPLSKFRVGSALLADSGEIFSGCNIENVSLSLSICAERVALLKALSVGERKFKKIAVMSSGDAFCFPCGACRQLLWECGKDIEVILKNVKGDIKKVHIRQLLPMPFEASF